MSQEEELFRALAGLSPDVQKATLTNLSRLQLAPESVLTAVYLRLFLVRA